MGTFELIIKDYDEVECSVKGCHEVGNQVKAIVTKYHAKVERVCYLHVKEKEND